MAKIKYKVYFFIMFVIPVKNSLSEITIFFFNLFQFKMTVKRTPKSGPNLVIDLIVPVDV